ncbi:hypothetical protein KAFR_0A03290 [Kazachstania africana CBS 2517]|uniref:Nucleosome assembly protein n=1 Tax=Kazachstania africana (strain ATCC 22294 / BCRC 22015 / CBS 2517 / CECT 1963 / NBRC 1671 / NRRL Y-8276) TaxID=1071382 RepID=H2AN14_KAZAF|nr:hypothetical protein KAFR_0A03290 [Kazachstania africana CBS 2517]CCF55764.1 hypothetical protein KAFR_0A03290 [Kazachstania africana CBS 2517]
MSSPIKTKPKSSMKIENAPTPHNTPASVLNSYLKNGNPVSKDKMPSTINEEDISKVLSSNQPLLLQSIQDKLGDLVGQDSGYLSNLPVEVKEKIFSLKHLQSELFKIEKEFQIEMFELENKYLNLYKPLFERRSGIVSGNVEPTEEEISKGREIDGEEEQEEGVREDSEEKIRGIPSFWLTALENVPIVNETITDRDAEVLDHLLDIKLEYLTEGKPGFKLTFIFDKENNGFFTNETLTKTYYYQSELGYSGDFIYDHAEGEEIDWKSNGSNVTVEVEMRKQRNKTTKQVRTIEKLTPIASFFNFFDPPKPNNEEEERDEDEEEEFDEDEEDLEARLALDYSLGEQIKDKLVPRAVDWFTGTALEFEYLNEEDEYDDDDDDDEDEDEYGDEAEDEDEQDDFAGRTEQAPECKQQ